MAIIKRLSSIKSNVGLNRHMVKIPSKPHELIRNIRGGYEELD